MIYQHRGGIRSARLALSAPAVVLLLLGPDLCDGGVIGTFVRAFDVGGSGYLKTAVFFAAPGQVPARIGAVDRMRVQSGPDVDVWLRSHISTLDSEISSPHWRHGLCDGGFQKLWRSSKIPQERTSLKNVARARRANVYRTVLRIPGLAVEWDAHAHLRASASNFPSSGAVLNFAIGTGVGVSATERKANETNFTVSHTDKHEDLCKFFGIRCPNAPVRSVTLGGQGVERLIAGDKGYGGAKESPTSWSDGRLGRVVRKLFGRLERMVVGGATNTTVVAPPSGYERRLGQVVRLFLDKYVAAGHQPPIAITFTGGVSEHKINAMATELRGAIAEPTIHVSNGPTDAGLLGAALAALLDPSEYIA